MAYIGRDTDKISNVEVLDNITFDGSSSYTLQKGGSNFTPSSANTLLVSIDGVVQAGNFTVSGSTIDFGTAVAGTSTCDFILHYGVGLITTPADGTVSLDKLSASGTKDATTFLRGDNTFAAAGSPSIDDNGNATAITIDSNNNVGIGKNSAISGYNLSLGKSTNVSGEFTGITFQESTSNFYGYVRAEDNATPNTAFVIGHTVRGIILKPSDTEAMRIDGNGQVNLLKTNFDAAASSSNRGLEIRANGAGALTLDLNVTDTGTATIMEFNNGNGNAGTIQTSGSSTSYNTSSDYRLKENVDYDFDATTRLKQLKPARFNFIADNTKTVDGFIAHEVSNIVPEAVNGTKDAVQVWEEGEELPEGVSVGDNKLDENGNTIIKPQGIDQSKLVPLLVKTIQELEARITALENA